jgi:hypothetical protein
MYVRTKNYIVYHNIYTILLMYYQLATYLSILKKEYRRERIRPYPISNQKISNQKKFSIRIN